MPHNLANNKLVSLMGMPALLSWMGSPDAIPGDAAELNLGIEARRFAREGTSVKCISMYNQSQYFPLGIRLQGYFLVSKAHQKIP
jgi:hypothetical protein